MKKDKLRKIGIVVWFLCTIALCACVFPINLIRRDTNVDPDLSGNYGVTERGQSMTQVFQAQTAYLSAIAFDIAFPDGKPEEGNLIFTLRQKEGEVLMEQSIALANVNDGGFSSVSVEKWISRGDIYAYSIDVESGSTIKFQAIYTINDAEATSGNLELMFNGESVPKQSVTRYVYGFPLNYKNVICLWAFIWAVSLILLELVAGGEILTKNKVAVKAEELLTKWQFPILALELCVIIALIIRICRNEAVDWDEAFTWQIVTKNNLAGMIKATAADVHPPLYYIMVMAAFHIFGKNIFVAKLVSVAGALASGILGITLVRKRWGVKAAVPFLMMVGLGTQMIYYNVDVRMYSWACFFVLAAGLFAYEILLTGKAGWWIAFTLVSLGGVYTQYFDVIPLFLIYLFLLVWILLRDRKQLKMWLGSSVAAVVGYLPWLGVVIDTVRRDSVGKTEEQMQETFDSLCRWAFESNIELSAYMPVVMFLVLAVCFFVGWRQYSQKERVFLAGVGVMFILVTGACALLSPYMNHFWHNRYLVSALLYIWLFMAAILARKNLLAWGMSILWLGILALSSYTVQQAVEMNTIPWIQQAKQLLEEVQQEDKIVYTFTSFNVMYEYYVPDADFIWYEDVDFEELGEEFYVIAWGGRDFSRELYASGFLSREVRGGMRLEEGVTAELWKITVHSNE